MALKPVAMEHGQHHVHGQHDEDSAIQEFLRWQHEARCSEQMNEFSTKEHRQFIPHTRLMAYLGSERRIQRLLDALFSEQDPVEQPSPKHIEQHYLRVFSILISIGHGPFIEHFAVHDSLQDRKLPFLVRPAHFPFSTGSDFFDAFRQKQWEFCVPTFEYDMHNYIDKECILPVVKSERIAKGGCAAIYKIALPPEYNLLEPPAHMHKECISKTDTYALKSYRTRNAEKEFKAERKAFLSLRNGMQLPRNIVGYYGSFIQDNKYYALLEYMDGGTLEDFMAVVPPPSNSNDIIKFWECMFGLIRGLTLIHGLLVEDEPEGRRDFLHGWHQDITPGNILLRTEPGCSVYESIFKLADFGTSHFKTTKSPKATDMDSHGTHAYGAPETFRFDDSMLQARLEVGKGVDVWSLGCVFSEVVTWVVFGLTELQHYRHRRRRELRQTLGLSAGHAFHDGSSVLISVVDNHKRLKEDRSVDDHLTPDVVDLINSMVAESQQRLTSQHAYQKSMRIIQKAKDGILEAIKRPVSYEMSVPRQATVGSDTTLIEEEPLPNHTERPFSTTRASEPSTSSPQPKAPILSVKEGLEWKSNWKKGIKKSITHAELLTELEDRDHVFLIDNSESMQAHMELVKNLVDLLAYMLKNYNPDGMEFYFTTNPSKTTIMKTKDILNQLNSTVAVGRCNMEDRLGSILEDYLARFEGRGVFRGSPRTARSRPRSASGTKAPRRLNLYVLTDGVWQPNNKPSKAIIPFQKRLKQQDLRWNHVGIQFIRFGNDPVGIKRLKHLETELDIVDTTAVSGNVWKMLLGATNDWFDDDDSTDIPNTQL